MVSALARRLRHLELAHERQAARRARQRPGVRFPVTIDGVALVDVAAFAVWAAHDAATVGLEYRTLPAGGDHPGDAPRNEP